MKIFLERSTDITTVYTHVGYLVKVDLRMLLRASVSLDGPFQVGTTASEMAV